MIRRIPSLISAGLAAAALTGLLILLAPAASAQAGGAANAVANAMKPALDVSMYRRCYTTDGRISLNLSTFNQREVTFSIYPIDLARVSEHGEQIGNMPARLAAVKIAGREPVRRWSYDVPKHWQDQWNQCEVDVPNLTAGVYMICATGGGAAKRTWVAVTDVALMTKRSTQTLLVWAVRARSGAVVPGAKLTVYTAKGAPIVGETDGDGFMRVDEPLSAGQAWIEGETPNGDPVFLQSGPPDTPEPYTVLTYTDRPIYRPGQLVQFKGMVRSRTEAEAPGGFLYHPYAGREIGVEIRDATDALISQETVHTNAYGSYSGQLQLAAEPTLGDYQLITRIGDRKYFDSFTVQDYRKPEYTVSMSIDKPYYLGGSTVVATLSAKYFSGEPVAAANVDYTVTFDGVDQATEPPIDGSVETDSKGTVTFTIPTKRVPVLATLNVSATVTDLSRHSISASASTELAPALYTVEVSTDSDTYYMPVIHKQPVVIDIRTQDYEGKPVSATVHVTVSDTREDRYHREYVDKYDFTVITDASGQGSVTFHPDHSNSFSVDAVSYDSEDDKIKADTGTFDVVDNVPVPPPPAPYVWPTLSISCDRSDNIYKPGETARIEIATDLVTPAGSPPLNPKSKEGVYQDCDALVTIEGERLYMVRRISIDKRNTYFILPVTEAMYPSVSVEVVIVQERQTYESEQPIHVEMDNQKLGVTVAADKEQYEPGDTATYTVTTRDYLGNPAPAEVSLGVVDASIYAIAQDTTPDLLTYFYGEQMNRITTDYSFAAMYSGGAYQTVPAPAAAAPGAPGIRIRKQFADTAYWNPFVFTDKTGAAKITFTIPDNLTGWHAIARASTLATQVGQATCDVTATMPLSVRLESPRFYVDGDIAIVSAVLRNDLTDARTVKVHLDATGMQLETSVDLVDAASLPEDGGPSASAAPVSFDNTVDVPAGGQVQLNWRAKIYSDQSVDIKTYADGGPGARDAMELTLPSHPNGIESVVGAATTVSAQSPSHTINLVRIRDEQAASAAWTSGDSSGHVDTLSVPADTSLKITLAPSIGSSLFDALGYLANAPDGDSECTISAMTPDIVVQQALDKFGVANPVRPDLTRWVNMAVQKLYRYQHADGGWNWWEFDQTDGDMTGYVLSGMIEARDAGYLVDSGRIARGLSALESLAQGEQDIGRLSDWLAVIAPEDPNAASPLLVRLLGHYKNLDTYGRASLAMALMARGVDLSKADSATTPTGAAPESAENRASDIVRRLEAEAIVGAPYVHWDSSHGDYDWRGDTVTLTAHVMRTIMAIDPHSPLLAGAARWLLDNRDCEAWESTRSSAEAVLALTRYMELTGEMKPDYTATISIDGAVVKTVTEQGGSAFDRPTVVTLTDRQLAGARQVVVQMTGTGTIYESDEAHYEIPCRYAAPVAAGITLKRTFTVTAADPILADSSLSGMDIDVDVTVNADQEYPHAVIEQPLPAGCEADDSYGYYSYPMEYWRGDGGYVRQEVRDDRIVYYFEKLPRGRTEFSYTLHCVTPGLYRILPSVAYLTYFPEVRASTAPAQARIVDTYVAGNGGEK